MDVIPAILTNKLDELSSQLEELGFCEVIQIDFMDGIFVDTKSIIPADLPVLNGFFEAHLMVEEPEKYFEVLKQKGFKRIIIHFESTKDVNKAILKANSLGFEVCIAFNPRTKPVIVKGANRYLFLTVNPGRQGQVFLEEVIDKVFLFKKQNPSLVIGVDGGVNSENIHLLRGLDFVCVGSFITKSKNMKEQYKKLVGNGSCKKS
ncbi:MAG: hypothetical protein ACMXX9_00755 [Candidatus Woesearchaeota archaeon]